MLDLRVLITGHIITHLNIAKHLPQIMAAAAQRQMIEDVLVH